MQLIPALFTTNPVAVETIKKKRTKKTKRKKTEKKRSRLLLHLWAVTWTSHRRLIRPLLIPIHHPTAITITTEEEEEEEGDVGRLLLATLFIISTTTTIRKAAVVIVRLGVVKDEVVAVVVISKCTSVRQPICVSDVVCSRSTTLSRDCALTFPRCPMKRDSQR